MNIPTDLTKSEAAHLHLAESTANQIWENRYQHLIGQGHDPVSAEELATIGEEVDSAVMTTETDVMNDAVDVINALRDLPHDSSEFQVMDIE